MRYKVEHRGSVDATPVTALDINKIEIVVDDDTPDKIELYMLDERGQRIEGGTFDKEAFMAAVRQFYEANF